VKGTVVGLFAQPFSAPTGMFRMYKCTFVANSTTSTVTCSVTLTSYGYSDFFELGPMSAGGGWDKAAWAAKGLPTSGELELTLHMHSVGA
jgi:hypothetical protein